MDVARSVTQTNPVKPDAVKPALARSAGELDLLAERSLLAILWYEFVHFTGVGLFSMGFSMRVEGSHNVPQTGPLLVVSNHQSYLDPWLAGMAVRRHLVYLARKTLFRNKWFASLIRSLNAVPIDQEGVGKEGIKTVLAQLRRDRAVLIFPEGERTRDGRMQPPRPGIHLLMRKAEAAILPVGIAGAYDAYPIHAKLPIPAPLFLPPGQGTLAVCVGKPLDSRHFANLPREQALDELFIEMKKVQERAEQLRRK